MRRRLRTDSWGRKARPKVLSLALDAERMRVDAGTKVLKHRTLGTKISLLLGTKMSNESHAMQRGGYLRCSARRRRRRKGVCVVCQDPASCSICLLYAAGETFLVLPLLYYCFTSNKVPGTGAARGDGGGREGFCVSRPRELLSLLALPSTKVQNPTAEASATCGTKISTISNLGFRVWGLAR